VQCCKSRRISSRRYHPELLRVGSTLVVVPNMVEEDSSQASISLAEWYWLQEVQNLACDSGRLVSLAVCSLEQKGQCTFHELQDTGGAQATEA